MSLSDSLQVLQSFSVALPAVFGAALLRRGAARPCVASHSRRNGLGAYEASPRLARLPVTALEAAVLVTLTSLLALLAPVQSAAAQGHVLPLMAGGAAVAASGWGLYRALRMRVSANKLHALFTAPLVETTSTEVRYMGHHISTWQNIKAVNVIEQQVRLLGLVGCVLLQVSDAKAVVERLSPTASVWYRVSVRWFKLWALNALPPSIRHDWDKHYVLVVTFGMPTKQFNELVFTLNQRSRIHQCTKTVSSARRKARD